MQVVNDVVLCNNPIETRNISFVGFYVSEEAYFEHAISEYPRYSYIDAYGI